MEDVDRPRRWPWFALILVLLLVGAWALFFGPARGLIGRGERAPALAEGRGARETYSPLPGPAELPYGTGTTESGDSAPGVQPAAERDRAGLGEAQTAVPAAAGKSATGQSPSPEPEPVAETPPVKTSPPPTATAPRTGAAPAGQFVIRRRFEPKRAWRTLTESSGPFYVHVESYHDSALAEESARRRGFAQFGFAIEPALIGGKQWYRMLIGPFADLPAAAALRDSLLDQTDEDYCLLVTTTTP